MDEISTLAINVRSAEVLAAAEAMVKFAATAKSADEAARGLSEIAQKTGVNVGLLRTALLQAKNAKEQDANLVGVLTKAHQALSAAVATTGASLTKPMVAARALGEAFQTLGAEATATTSSLERAYAGAALAAQYAASNATASQIATTMMAGGMDKANNSTQKYMGTLPLFRALLLYHVTERLIEAGIAASEAGEKIREFAESAGTSTEFFQEFSFAMLQAGIDQQKATTGLEFFTRALGEAQNGNKKVIETLRNVGVSLNDAFNNDVQTNIYKVAEGLKNVDAATREDTLQILFGRGGKQFGAAFEQGAQGIKAFADQGDRLHAFFSDDDIKRSERFTAQIRTLGQVLKVNSELVIQEFFTNPASPIATLLGVGEGLLGIGEKADKAATPLGDFNKKMEETRRTAQAFADASANPAIKNYFQSIADSATGAINLNNPLAVDASKISGPTGVSAAAKATIEDQIKDNYEMAASIRKSAEAAAYYQAVKKADEILDQNRINHSKENLAIDKQTLELRNRLIASIYASSTATVQRKDEDTFKKVTEEIIRQTDKYRGLSVAIGQGVDAMNRERAAALLATNLSKLKTTATAAEREEVTRLSAAESAAQDAADKRKRDREDGLKATDAERKALTALTSQYDSLSTVQRKVADELGLVEQGFARGTVSASELAKAVDGAQKELENFNKEQDQTNKKLVGELTSAIERGASSFLEAATNTDKSTSALQRFQNVAQGLYKDLTKLVLQLFVLNPLINKVKTALGDTSAPLPEGNLNFLFGGAKKTVAPASAALDPSASTQQAAATTQQTAAATQQTAAAAFAAAVQTFAATQGTSGSIPVGLGNPFGGGSGDLPPTDVVPAGRYGGMVGALGSSALVNPAAFLGARSYKRGGMVGDPDAVPIIAHRRERVLNEREAAEYNAAKGNETHHHYGDIHFHVKDYDSFRKSKAQIHADIKRAQHGGRA